MTSDEALEDHDPISVRVATRELAAHGCRIIETLMATQEQAAAGKPNRIHVTNDLDAPEWLDCTPAAIMAWLGY